MSERNSACHNKLGRYIKGIYMVAKPVRSLNVCKKRLGTSPERHCLTAMPYRLCQGNLNPKVLNRHKIATNALR